MSGHKWKPLERVTRFKEMPRELLAAAMEATGLNEQGARQYMEAARDADGVEWFANDLYQVEVRSEPENKSKWLCIRRRDGYVGRDWRHFQLIKNQLVGEECEAVELYPAESRCVDTSNKYHLFACTDPTFRFPFGYTKRDVQHGDEKTPGLRQAPPIKHARRR